MKLIKYIFFLFIMINSIAQAQDKDKNVLVDLDYNVEYTAGFNWNTNGAFLGGFNFKYSKRKKANIFNTFCLELVNVKHPKEFIEYPDTMVNSYTRDKQNYLFVIRPQYGKEIVMFRKENDEGIQMNMIFAAGPSIALVKPYYVLYGNNSSNYSSTPYDPNIMTNRNNIFGSGGIFEGMSKSKIKLGLNAKISCLFEFGTYRQSLTGAEVGFLAEMYPDKITILANQSNRSVFFSAFLNVYFGVRE